MLERLELFDFQCHENFAVDLDPKVTVFVGKSDQGKSAILRALRWLATNRPRGDGLTRHGSDSVKVRLTLDGGRKIVRDKGKDNFYKLDGERFVDLRQPPVPQPIADLLNIDEVNFQSQLDPPWWFLKSPGEVSKELNAIVDLGLIDRTMASLASKHRQAEAEARVCEGRLKEAEGRVESLSWVPECQADMEELERVTEELERIRQKSLRIASLAKGVREAGEGIRALRRAVKEAAKAVQAASAWRESAARADRIHQLVDKVSKSRRELAEAKAEADKAAKELRTATKGRCPICGKATKGE